MFGLQIHAEMKFITMFRFWQNWSFRLLDVPGLLRQGILQKKFKYTSL